MSQTHTKVFLDEQIKVNQAVLESLAALEEMILNLEKHLGIRDKILPQDKRILSKNISIITNAINSQRYHINGVDSGVP